MKIIDVFKSGDEQQIADILCKLVEKNNWDCSRCPVEHYCTKDHKGFMDFLQIEMEDFR